MVTGDQVISSKITRAFVCLLLFVSFCLGATYSVSQPEVQLNAGESQEFVGKDCSTINGIYKYYGESDEGDELRNPRLDAIAFGRIPIGGQPKSVSITYLTNKGVIEVKIVGNKLFPLDSSSFSVSAVCKHGKIVISRHREGYTDGGYVKSESLTRLYTGDNGALIVDVAYESGTQYMPFIRSHEKAQKEYRFLPLRK